MFNVRKVTDDLYYVGGNDNRLALFENIFPIPEGVSYNSYLLMDEKTCLVDTVDRSIGRELLENVKQVLNGRDLDYLLVNHMEPDHAASLQLILDAYPKCHLLASEKAVLFMRQFGFEVDDRYTEIKEGDTMNFGKHTFAFVEAPMVHWPEVIMTYDTYDKVLFSADGFGSFKSLDGHLFADEVDRKRDRLDEARRYLTNIVGKYGTFIQAVLAKAATLDIKYICPLHGLVWRKDLGYFIGLYDKWSRYEPEVDGAMIVYASMYGNTERAAFALASKLCDKGMTNVKVYDVSKTDVSYLIAGAFKYSNIVLCSVTYNLGVYPKMKDFINDMSALNVQNRVISLMDNGSWAPTAADKMEEMFDNDMKIMDVLPEQVNLISALNDRKEADMDAMADSIIDSIKKRHEAMEKAASQKGKTKK